MTKPVDIGSKRLISLAPDTWVRWLTGDAEAQSLEFLSGDFQWVLRAADVLIKAVSPHHGTFLIVNEIQFRPDPRMPKRIRAYAALAEERYNLNVFPVVINILPLQPLEGIVASYHSEFMGLMAHQDYKVINLWEVDVAMVQERNWTTLLPFAPILKGGDNALVIQQALARLREVDRLADMEALLAFFATFVMTPEEVLRLMRWNMPLLRESPWYNEIEEEATARGLEKGLQQGLQQGRRKERYEMLIRLLDYRFGETPFVLQERLRHLGIEQLGYLIDVALTAPSLEAVQTAVSSLPPEPMVMNGANEMAW